MGLLRSWALLLLCVLAACGETSSHRVAVALRTDFGPATEFDGVTVGIGGDEALEHLARADRDYVEGVRIGEAGVEPGEVNVLVSLFQDGRLVIERRVSVRIEAPLTIVTVVITRDCRGVVCPGDGNPLFESCLGGQCVDPRCTVESPEFCPAPTCDAPSCVSDVSCVVPTCRDGLCFQVADDSLCGAREVCAASTGCVSMMQSMDGGVGPPSCTDGVISGDESDIDCGGACPVCPDNAMCNGPEDCESGVCDTTCAAPSCGDGIQNGAETEVDCGGGCVCAACDAQTEIPPSECLALAAFYNSAGGAQWVDNVDWFSNNSPCSWSGITCTDGSVRELRFYEDALAGTLPAALGDLTELTHFEINARGWESTALSGSIPPELANITGLQHLQMNRHLLDEPIPPELASLAFLRTLDLGTNQLTGTIPPELGAMPALQTLILWDNALSGSIPPELGALAALASLQLSGNQLTGGIPDELAGLRSLHSLYLGANPLGGSIPVSLTTLGRLEQLYLAGAELTGTIPPELGNLRVLRGLSLQNNQLSGEIPAELANLRASLTGLNLSSNDLSGTIPPELAGLAVLSGLDLHNNQLTGSIPGELGSLSQLSSLRLEGNFLSGQIPQELGNLSELVLLNLSGNSLDGPIPAELANSTLLSDFRLRENLLSGEIPDALMGLSALELIHVCPNDGLTASASMQSWLSAIASNDWIDGC